MADCTICGLGPAEVEFGEGFICLPCARELKCPHCGELRDPHEDVCPSCGEEKSEEEV